MNVRNCNTFGPAFLIGFTKSVLSGLQFNTTIDILFGISNDNKDDLIDVFNYCILFAKNYIYICKVNDSSISLITYKQELFNRLEGEKVIASMQNKLADFVTKWSSIVDNLKL